MKVAAMSSMALAVVLACLLALAALLANGVDSPLGADIHAAALGAPSIECAWQLPDMQPDVVGVQYVPLAGDDIHDADMNATPDADPASAGTQVPCDFRSPGQPPSQPDGVHHMVQVLPNAGDFPEPERVQLWAAVDDSSGLDAIDHVYWEIFRPDGSMLTQVDVPSSSGGGVVRAVAGDATACAQLGESTSTGSMFEASVHTGQVSSTSVDGLDQGLVARCQQSLTALYFADIQLSRDQPCGEYRVETLAVSGGMESTLTDYFDVECFFDLSVDFTNSGVDWGEIRPGVAKTISGDLDPYTPGHPTIQNLGNEGMFIGLEFATMTLQATPGSRGIDRFGASFGRSSSTPAMLSPVSAGATVWFDDATSTNPGESTAGSNQLLCADDQGRLDVSIDPAQGLPVGIYDGTLSILAKAAPDWWNVCLDRFWARSLLDAGGIGTGAQYASTIASVVYDPTPVVYGPAGTLTITATFTNTTGYTLVHPYFTVSTLTNGDMLLNADNGPGGVGARLTPSSAALGGDGQVSPGESVTQEFRIGLASRTAFTFTVNVNIGS